VGGDYGHRMDHRFGDGTPFSLGVEEELFVVDPGDGRMVNRGPEVLERLDPPASGDVEGEVQACQVELITGVCETVGQATDELDALGRAVLDTGVGLLGSGTHPSAEEGDAEVNDKERYRLISALLGDAAATPVSALHVHVGMPDPETAIRVFNGLRRHLPLLEALGANAPFRHGRDTGLASARELTLRGWPRSDAPRAFAGFDDFASYAERLTAVAEVPDYTFHWWKMRPHPRLGTVEVRALDVQARREHTAALVALVHCLARHEAEADPVAGPSPEVLDEASSKAGRLGVAARLPDADLELRPVADLLAAAMDVARPRARELDCAEELEGLTALLELGGGAGLQHTANEEGGMEGLLNTLTRR
jgi:carboxylate-amine ligase